MTLQKQGILTLTDAQLVAQYKETQDGQVFGEIYTRYHKKVYFTCLGIVKDRDIAFDMVQDVMIKMMDNLLKLEHGFLLGLWVNRIAKNHSITYVKHRGKLFLTDMAADYEIAAEETDIETILLQEQQFELMEWAVKELPIEDQELVQLRYSEGYSVQDLQNKYDLSESAVKMRLSRVRKKIARTMLIRLVTL